MAVLKNNQFSSDDDDTRQARLNLVEANIDTNAAEIAVAGALLAWAQDCYTEFVDARSGADKEAGDVDEAYQEYQLKFNATREYYVDAKELLAAVLKTYQDQDEAQEKYGIMGRTPRTAEKLFSAIKQWRKTHDEFVAAADPRVIAEAIVAKMETDADAFDDLWRTAVTEKKEARAAFDVKQEIFSRDTDNLRLVYMLAKMAWGDNDPRLHELGFVPASEIWTPGQPEPQPEEFPAWPGPTGKFTLRYWGDGVVEIVYGGVQESTIGWLHRSVPGAEDWIEVNKHLPMNEEDILPFREMHVPIGMWEYRFIPMRGVEKGIASFALIEVV